MKTKKRIEKKLEEFNTVKKEILACFSKQLIDQEDYEDMISRLSAQQAILSWVLSTEWELDDISIEECIDISYNHNSNDIKWSNVSKNDMHFEFTLCSWFDVEEKFNIHLLDDGSEWVDIYVFYDPINKELFVRYSINSSSNITHCDYNPTYSEKLLLIAMIEDWCEEHNHMSSKNMILEILKKEEE